MKLDVSQIRLWTFYKRQNQTIRTEKPVGDDLNDSEYMALMNLTQSP